MSACIRLRQPNDKRTRNRVLSSGGQQQRTAIARALVKDAALLLLDEPLRNRKLPKAEICERVTEVAEMLELSDVLQKRAANLSADAK